MMEKIKNSQAYVTCGRLWSAAWGWTKETLWPVYTTGMVLSVVCLIAGAYEKQVMVDSYFGCSKAREDLDKDLKQASELLDKQSTSEVKREVWEMDREKFLAKYEQRNESDNLGSSKAGGVMMRL